MMEAKNLQAGYGKSVKLNNISCKFPDGKITAVVGMNGCGKSTLFKTIAGLIKPMNGTVILEGKKLSALTDRERARQLSYLPQSRNIPVISVERMVLHGRFPYLDYPRRYKKEDYEMAEKAMERVGILPLKDKNMSELSGGERQKAYLAMAIAQDTKNILLDEPTTFLDITHQIEIMRLMEEIKGEGKAVAVVLHDISAALRYGDYLMIMENGEIKQQGKPGLIYESGVLEQVFKVKVRDYLGEDNKKRFYFL